VRSGFRERVSGDLQTSCTISASETVEGSGERRLAAKFILDCLRAHETPHGIAQRIDALEGQSIINIAEETRRLAFDLRLVPPRAL
jgi:hypothetical protein